MEAQEKNITVNKKAEYEYYIEQRIEAGISLVGTEVKALRQNKANLTDGYAFIRNGEAWLIGANISRYDQGNIYNHDPVRKRKLLLKKSELRKLDNKIKEKGYTLIPLRLYFKQGKVKLELGLARGKKSYDKRESIAKKDIRRELERNIK
ncbi:MAG: SsrA-binding protein SmpB [Melioribacteraceae bacterium]|nr:SsrA-binding protein SmpB [Melioribacteraceae bacterium]